MTAFGQNGTRSWKEFARDVSTWFGVACFLAILPLGFPVLVSYKAFRREKLRGKGAAGLFLLWIGMTAVWGLVAVAFATKGWSGLRTLFFVCGAVTLWACVVFAAMRLFVEIVALVLRIQRCFKQRSKSPR